VSSDVGELWYDLNRVVPLPAPFPLTPFGKIKLNADETNYVVKGLLPCSGLAVVWGPPKSGKSFWCMDMLLHAALGWEYRGRKVQQANVVYVALEGRNGIPARVEAFKIRHEVNEAPFYLMTHPVNLIVDADALIASVRAQGVVPGTVCLDTLNRSLVGSESNTRTTTLVRWRDLCEAKMIADSEKPDSKRKAFVRASIKLQDLKIIGVWQDQVWVTGQAGQART
jgi:AAA domain